MTIYQFLLSPHTWSMLALTFALLGVFLILNRKNNNLSIRIIELEDELQAITNSAIGVGKKLHEVESELKVVESQQEEIAHRESHQPKPYLQAAKMAQMGASVADLMESCQLTQGEAELLVHLHQNTEAA